MGWALLKIFLRSRGQTSRSRNDDHGNPVNSTDSRWWHLNQNFSKIVILHSLWETSSSGLQSHGGQGSRSRSNAHGNLMSSIAGE